MERRWHQQTWVIIALLVLFTPVGLYLMWRHATWHGGIKWAVFGIWAMPFVLALTLAVVALPIVIAGVDDSEDVQVAIGSTSRGRSPTVPVTEPSTSIQGSFELGSAECEYVAELLPLHSDATNALTELLELFAETRLSSDAWAMSVTVQLAIISVTYERVSALDPPASLQWVHDEMYLEGLSKLNGTTFLIVDGVGFRDTDLLRDATDLLLEGGEDIRQATQQLEALQKLGLFGRCP